MNPDWNKLAVHKAPPKELLTKLRIPVKKLLGPGPTNCSKRVLQALQNQTLGPIHPEIWEVLDDIKAGLQYVFQTKNRLTLVVSAAGHGGMEACLTNLLESGDKIVIVKSGFWGERAADICSRIGAHVEIIDTGHERSATLEEVEAALKKHRPAAIFMVHGESSTGLKQPMEGVGDLVHKYDALLIVDTVASLVGEPFFTDSWGVDAVFTGSQKALGAPPGLAPISFSPRAEDKLFRRKTKPYSLYLDLRMLGVYWQCFGNKQRVYHHTVSSTLLYGLREALAEIAEEGLTASWSRHAAAAARLRKGLELQGVRCCVKIPRYQLSTIITIEVPPGVDDRIIVQRAMERYNVEFSRGLGPTVGKIIRIGLLQTNATTETVDLALRVLDEGFKEALQSKL